MTHHGMGAEVRLQERESRPFFYVDDDGVVRAVTGYVCEAADGYWWCPEIGVTAGEGFHLFADRDAAYAKAFERATMMLEVAKANLARIEAER